MFSLHIDPESFALGLSVRSDDIADMATHNFNMFLSF